MSITNNTKNRPVSTVQFSPRQRLGNKWICLIAPCKGQFNFNLPLQGETLLIVHEPKVLPWAELSQAFSLLNTNRHTYENNLKLMK